MANKVGLTDAKIAGLKAPAAGQIELADGIVPGLKQSQILLASKVTNTNSVSGLSKAWKRIRASVDEKLGYEAGHFTMHDIRRTVATGLQRLGIAGSRLSPKTAFSKRTFRRSSACSTASSRCRSECRTRSSRNFWGCLFRQRPFHR